MEATLRPYRNAGPDVVDDPETRLMTYVVLVGREIAEGELVPADEEDRPVKVVRVFRRWQCDKEECDKEVASLSHSECAPMADGAARNLAGRKRVTST